MRITKADLAKALEQAARFNQLELVYVSLRKEIVTRDRPGFIGVHQYGRGMLALRDEFGTDMVSRYLVK
jgi:hypothetical protein